MAHWSDDFQRFLTSRWGEDIVAETIRARYAWAEDLHRRAQDLLQPESIASMPPQEVYQRLRELGVPQCPIRIAHLGRVNDAERIRESLIKLLTVQGGLEEKYRLAKIPQAGVVTITELLCVAKPMRFVLRNTAFTRAMAKVVPLYSVRALDELPYAEFMDICGELAKVMQARLEPLGLADWARELRFLLLYAVLTEKP